MTMSNEENTIWYDIVVEHTPAMKAIELKNEIINNGLVHGVDFEWRWTGSTWEAPAGYNPSTTRFSFRDESMATFYRLKWQ